MFAQLAANVKNWDGILLGSVDLVNTEPIGQLPCQTCMLSIVYPLLL